MTYKTLFVDSDVLLDMLLEREPYYIYTQALLFESEKRNIQLKTSALIISNVHYVLSKSIGSYTSKKRLKEIVQVIEVLSLESDIINIALDSSFADFEDAVQHLIAKRNNCDAIVTRNTRDFKNSDIPVFKPEQFLNILN
jgi:predicted nucleic acid-binding protein